MTARRFAALLYLQRFVSELMPIYPLYALMFADRGGLSTAQISGLFAWWVLVALVAEVPTGVLADRRSRRFAIVAGSVLQGLAFCVWLVAPSIVGYAVGFLLWGVGYAFGSGAFQAYVYEQLRDGSGTEHFTRVLSRSRSMQLLAMVVAYLAAAVLAPRGYGAVLALSVAFSVLAAGLAIMLPPDRPRTAIEASGHFDVLRTALGRVRAHRSVAAFVLAGGMLMGIVGSMEEYVPLFYRHVGFATSTIPLLLVAGLLISTLVGWYAHLLARLSFATLALGVVVAGVLLLAGTAASQTGALLAMLAFMRLVRLVHTLYEARMQHVLDDDTRATVGSLASMGGEIVALALIAVFTLVSALTADTWAYRTAALLVIGAGFLLLARRPAHACPAPAGAPPLPLPGHPVP